MSKAQIDGAIKLYEIFYQFNPKTVVETSLIIPKSMKKVGRMLATQYASDKWEKKVNYYNHDHDKGVFLYEPGTGAKVPGYITSTCALAKIGRCIGLRFDAGKGEELIQMPGCCLYAIPSGRALVVVKDEKSIEGIIWGGNLRVESRGIVY